MLLLVALLLVALCLILLLSFDPSTIAGLQCWLKDTGTYQGTTWDNTTTAASADGDVVGSWLDQSGNAQHAYSGSNVRRGVLKTAANGINSLPVVRFDGTGSAFNLDTRDGSTVHKVVSALTSFTVFYVYRPLNVSHEGVVLGGVASSDYWPDVDATNFYCRNADGFKSFAHGIANNTAYYLTFRRSGTTVNVYKNGTELGSSPQTLAGNTASDLYTLGADAGISVLMNADLGELLIYDSALSSTDRANVEGYLNTKWFGSGGTSVTVSWPLRQESLASLAPARPCPQEALASLAPSRPLSDESLASQVASPRLPDEVLASVRSLPGLPAESLAGAARTAGLPEEALASAALAGGFRQELLASATAPRLLPGEFTATSRAAPSLPAENLASATLRPALPLSSLASQSTAAALPAEFPAACRRAATLPAEWSGAIALTLVGVLPGEVLASAAPRANLAGESLAGQARTARLPVEDLAQTFRAGPAPAESLLAAGGGRILLESLAGLARSTALPDETLRVQTTPAALPGEAPAGARRAAPLPAEWLTGGVLVMAVGVSPLEWLAVPSQGPLVIDVTDVPYLQIDTSDFPVLQADTTRFPGGSSTVSAPSTLTAGSTYVWQDTVLKNGAPWPLSTSTVYLLLRDPGGVVKQYLATVIDPVNAVVQRQGLTTDLYMPGLWSRAWRVVDPASGSDDTSAPIVFAVEGSP